MVIYMYIAPGQGQTTPWDQIIFINSIIQSVKSFAASFPSLNDFYNVFSHSKVQATQFDLAVK